MADSAQDVGLAAETGAAVRGGCGLQVNGFVEHSENI
jgi:hypothetical protein